MASSTEIIQKANQAQYLIVSKEQKFKPSPSTDGFVLFRQIWASVGLTRERPFLYINSAMSPFFYSTALHCVRSWGETMCS